MKLRLALAFLTLASPAFAQSLPAPDFQTQAADNNTTKAATTGFVLGQESNSSPLVNGIAAPGTSPRVSRYDHVHPTDSTRAAAATTFSAGAGLTGGGSLSANRTISYDPTQVGWGVRNRLFNSGMRLDQRNGGNTATLGTISGTANYTVDRWIAYESASGTGLTAQQTSVKSGGVNYALRIQRANASTNTNTIALAQVLETNANIDLQGQAVTLSYRARVGASFSAASSQITAAIISGTGTDQTSASFAAGTWAGQSTCGTVTQTLTTSFAYYVVTCTAPSGATQLGVKFSWAGVGTAGVNDWADVTDVELVPGSWTAAQITPERVPIAVADAMCKRFYRRDSLSIRVLANAGATYEDMFQFDMRAQPAAALVTAGTRINAGSVSAFPTSATASRFEIISTSAGDTAALGDLWSFDAEL